MFVSNRTIQFYFDRERGVVDSASNLRKYSGLQPFFHINRFLYIGSYQIHQHFPYYDISSGDIRRKHYNSYEVVVTKVK